MILTVQKHDFEKGIYIKFFNKEKASKYSPYLYMIMTKLTIKYILDLPRLFFKD